MLLSITATARNSNYKKLVDIGQARVYNERNFQEGGRAMFKVFGCKLNNKASGNDFSNHSHGLTLSHAFFS